MKGPNDPQSLDQQPGLPVAVEGRLSTPAKHPFREATLGGTFHRFHGGHEEYLMWGLRLAERVHIFVSSDTYARAKKDYSAVRTYRARLNSVQKFMRSLDVGDRVKFARLNGEADLKRFVIQCRGLDLAIVDKAYNEFFVNDLNSLRVSNGLKEFFVLFKPRTSEQGLELSSSLWTRVPLQGPPQPNAEQKRLFD